MQTQTDEILFSGIKADDYFSFNQLFNRYYSRLCAYAFEITKNRFAAEDIIQEIFVNLWNARHKIEIQGKVLHYLFRASRNASLNFIRNEASRQKSLENYSFSQAEINNDILEEQEFISFVEDCIEELPERSRQVFKMSRVDGYKQKDIAEKLGVSIKTIKNQIWKSLQYIKSCLELKDAF